MHFKRIEIQLELGEKPDPEKLKTMLSLKSGNREMMCRSCENGHAAWWRVTSVDELARVISAVFFYRDGGNMERGVVPHVSIRFA